MENNETQSYFWQDKSGRGYSNNCTKDELLDAFNPYEGYDISKSDNDDDDENIGGDYLSDSSGETVARWLQGEPAIGDVWENAANRITRTK